MFDATYLFVAAGAASIGILITTRYYNIHHNPDARTANPRHEGIDTTMAAPFPEAVMEAPMTEEEQEAVDDIIHGLIEEPEEPTTEATATTEGPATVDIPADTRSTAQRVLDYLNQVNCYVNAGTLSVRVGSNMHSITSTLTRMHKAKKICRRKMGKVYYYKSNPNNNQK